MKKQTHDFYCNGLFIYSDREPFLIGKIVKLQKHEDAEDYKAKQVYYIIEQVPGFSIFIVQAGFSTQPERQVSDAKIQQRLQEMCDWYFENKIQGQPSIIRKYKLQTNAQY